MSENKNLPFFGVQEITEVQFPFCGVEILGITQQPSQRDKAVKMAGDHCSDITYYTEEVIYCQLNPIYFVFFRLKGKRKNQGQVLLTREERQAIERYFHGIWSGQVMRTYSMKAGKSLVNAEDL